MNSYKEAPELALAFSAVIREMHQEFSVADNLPLESNSDFETYQTFISRIVLIQRDLDDLIDRAMLLESNMQDSPVQVLDFSSEWDLFD